MLIESDTASGFTTSALGWQVNMVTFPNQDPMEVARVATDYNVDSFAYMNEVYPVNRQKPWMEIPGPDKPESNEKPLWVPIVILAVCAITFVVATTVCVMKCRAENGRESGALDRNNDKAAGPI